MKTDIELLDVMEAANYITVGQLYLFDNPC